MEDKANKQAGMHYERHLFICINHRSNARSCAGSNATALQEYAKRQSRLIGLPNLDRIRVNKSGCLGRCEHGPVAVVYPDGDWYAYRNKDDLAEILSEHIGHGRVVERLRIPPRNEACATPRTRRWGCVFCDFVYDEAVGLPEAGYVPGMAFEALPEQWVCPACEADKDVFQVIA